MEERVQYVPSKEELYKRVERLEKRVAELEEAVQPGEIAQKLAERLNQAGIKN
ncbi:MAG: hypothetical protein PWR10_1823 [Halanaerobiales bacterium]|nr:hypothetical protein [Halanaerobiales bacterium]